MCVCVCARVYTPDLFGRIWKCGSAGFCCCFVLLFFGLLSSLETVRSYKDRCRASSARVSLTSALLFLPWVFRPEGGWLRATVHMRVLHHPESGRMAALCSKTWAASKSDLSIPDPGRCQLRTQASSSSMQNCSCRASTSLLKVAQG